MSDIYKVLDELGIPVVKHEHPAVYTCEEADKFYEGIPGGKSKNLFLRSKKGDKHFLVIVESSKQVDLQKLGEIVGEPKLGFASPERMMKYLGLTPGSVSPFGLINDVRHEVNVVVDNALMEYEILHYHPNINTATLEISRDDFKKFLNWTTNSVQFVDL